MKIGIHVTGADAPAVVRAIRAAEDAGLECAWMTSGGTAPDPLTIYAAAAVQTTRIKLGTAIIQTFPRHPLALVQQCVALDQLAPGRIRLGVGPSGSGIEQQYGIPFVRPQEHLREYVTVLREALTGGGTNFMGTRITAKGRLAGPTGVVVMASALRPNAYRLCGEVADGAISWLSPVAYLRDTARPALEAGAAAAGRPVPPLIAHVPIAVSEDAEAVRAAVRAAFGFFPRLPQYQAMFVDAGFPETRDGTWSDALIDAAVIHGSEATVVERLRTLSEFGVDESYSSIISPAGDSGAHERALAALAKAAS